MAKEKKSADTVETVKFAVPAFRHEGKVYKSADVEKAANNGDEDAEALVAALVAMGSGVVEVVEVEEAAPEPTEEEKAALAAEKAEKAAAAKAKKAEKAAATKAAKESKKKEG
jgi:hypothetical protein